ncbi:MAG: class I poly(R)-hydroxyalkanoic acid synthase [Bauldia sp.]
MTAKDGDPPDPPLWIKNPEAFAVNLARTIEEAGKAASAYLKPREEGKVALDYSDTLTDVIKTFAKVAEYWTAEPERALMAQNRLLGSYLALWTVSLKRMMGEPAQAVARPDPRDKRFADPEWSQNAFFDFLKQLYLVTSRWAEDIAVGAVDLDPRTRQKAAFYVKQIVNALAPTNFILTNPEVLRETLASDGANLVRGMHMLAEDIKAGGGNLKIRHSDLSKFRLGDNLANTPGKVIHQNDLCQLIQYQAATKTVLRRPLLMVPPWINKFYILDLSPERSFIRWCVEQGHTVFVISWVNPDEHQADKSFENYMRQGIFEALDVIGDAAGADAVNAVGYCVGGTLLAAALAHAAVTGDHRIRSATLFASQVDFTHAGDLSVFVDEEQIERLEKKMSVRGYLEGNNMAVTFNMLRANDLIWPYVIGNYFKGREPAPFDILYWNSDATRMPAANHSFYLRNCYLDNRFAKGLMELGGVRLDPKKVKVPIYNLATTEDHIAPARSVFYGSSFFGGKVTFVLTGSGHIAGVINPPERHKYQYWTGPAPRGDAYEAWRKKAKEHPGSWWPHWQKWILGLDKTRVKARPVGRGKVKPIEDAPGSYVRVKS